MSDEYITKKEVSLREELQLLKDDADLNLPPKVYEEVLGTLRYRASLGFSFCTIYCVYPDYIMNKLKNNGVEAHLEETPNTITVYWGPKRENSYVGEE